MTKATGHHRIDPFMVLIGGLKFTACAVCDHLLESTPTSYRHTDTKVELQSDGCTAKVLRQPQEA